MLQGAQSPAEEAERLRALVEYDILDTPPESGFDDLARIAATICGAPIALVSFVDESREWVKSCVGLEVEQMPREIALGAHAILQRDLFVVRDTLTDDRFAANPLVVGCPGIRFYAGAPLVVADVHAIGTLCVMDTEPRALTEEQSAALAALARQVVALLELRHRVHELRKVEEQTRLIVEHATDVIYTHDVDGRITSVNHAAVELFGYSEAELLGLTIHDVLDPEFIPSVEAGIRSGFGGAGHTRPFALRVRHRDGRTLWVEVRASLVSSPGGRSTVLGVLRDITRRKATEEEMRRARAAAEAATRAKSEFLANMSHEIRTPMNAVIGMAELLLASGLTDEQRNYAETIQTSGEALLSVINDILDFSKIESGKLAIDAEPFDLRECIEGALDVLAPRAAAKRLGLAYVIEPGTPPGMVSDPLRVRQVLVNLVSNGVKFAARGEVVVSAHAEELSDGRFEFQFDVRDTGIGIPADRTATLFEPFSQVDASTARRYGGTGLGLAISKRLVELLGGRVWVESEPGSGSTFSFTIVAEGLAETPAADPPDQLAVVGGRRVLVADASAASRATIERLLTGWGMRSSSVGTSAEAIAQLSSGEVFDLALVEGALEAGEGVPLAEALGSLDATRELPVVVLAPLGAAPWPSARQVAPTRPVKARPLLDAMSRALGAPRRNTGALQPSVLQAAQTSRVRILLAEDHPVNQRVALLTLERLGYKADVVENGAEAVLACEREQYDVVLMDVHMPEMDGLQATRAIRDRWPSGGPRIIAMTANAMQGDREMCLAAGMDDYLSKPVRAAELRDVLNQCEHDPRPQDLPGRVDDVLDTARIAELRELGGDDGDALVAQLVDIFFSAAEDHLASARDALSRGDADAVRAAAHALKGGASNIGLRRLQAACSALECAACEGDLAALPLLLEAVEREQADALVAVEPLRRAS